MISYAVMLLLFLCQRIRVVLFAQCLCRSYLELLSQLTGDQIGHSQVDLRPEKNCVESEHFKVCLSNSKEVSIPLLKSA